MAHKVMNLSAFKVTHAITIEKQMVKLNTYRYAVSKLPVYDGVPQVPVPGPLLFPIRLTDLQTCPEMW